MLFSLVDPKFKMASTDLICETSSSSTRVIMKDNMNKQGTDGKNVADGWFWSLLCEYVFLDNFENPLKRPIAKITLASSRH